MSESTGGELDQGSTETGHVQQVVLTLQMRIDEAWRAYSQHTRNCEACRTGIDCAGAVDLHAVWRELVPRT